MASTKNLMACNPDEFMRRLDSVRAEVAFLGLLQAEQMLVSTLGGLPPEALSPSEQGEWRACVQRTLSELRRQILAFGPEGPTGDQNITCFTEAGWPAIAGVDEAVKAAAEAAIDQARIVSTSDHLQLEQNQP